MKDVITKTKLLEHPIEKVWSAITKAKELSTWFIKTDFKAEVGFNYTFSSTGEEGCVPITGIVKEASPYTLVYTWNVEDTHTETTVKWVLEDIDGKTKLYLEHSGISLYPGDTAIKMFESFDGGWDNCIKGLDKFMNENVYAK
ncbi:MAG: SRPBCC domain-containing protein [Bacteroidota bacterium]